MELGILFMLAVSSLATYGILLAGFRFPIIFLCMVYILNILTKNATPMKFILLMVVFFEVKNFSRFFLTKRALKYNTYIKKKTLYFNLPSQVRHFVHIAVNNNSSNINKEQCTQDLFKDRIIPVIPFDRNLIKSSCLNYTDKICKEKFIKS